MLNIYKEIEMKALIAIIAFGLTTNAFAISRYNSKSMSCDQIKSVISSEGAVILRYPSTRVPGLTLYDRYVKHAGYCWGSDVRNTTYVPSSDSSKCRVYNCKPRSNDR